MLPVSDNSFNVIFFNKDKYNQQNSSWIDKSFLLKCVNWYLVWQLSLQYTCISFCKLLNWKFEVDSTVNAVLHNKYFRATKLAVIRHSLHCILTKNIFIIMIKNSFLRIFLPHMCTFKPWIYKCLSSFICHKNISCNF